MTWKWKESQRLDGMGRMARGYGLWRCCCVVCLDDERLVTYLSVICPVNAINGRARNGDSLSGNLLEPIAELDQLDRARTGDGGTVHGGTEDEVGEV